jgi:hypothetical protein
MLLPAERQVCLAAVQRPKSKHGSRGNVRQPTGMTLTANELSCTEQLARFFPRVNAVRVQVQVTVLRTGGGKLRESAIVEFAESEHAIFLSTLPLEFDDRVKIERDQEGRTAEAAVAAVQYHEGRKAVAVRFLHGPCHWVTQP